MIMKHKCLGHIVLSDLSYETIALLVSFGNPNRPALVLAARAPCHGWPHILAVETTVQSNSAAPIAFKKAEHTFRFQKGQAFGLRVPLYRGGGTPGP